MLRIESEEQEYIINIDRLLIQGVIINLIDNSLKYGSDNTTIKIKLTVDNSNIYLTISDNGSGIPEKYISKVFDKFFRVPRGDKHNIKGYGLGLSYAYLTMQQHNGAIEVKNLSEGGCSFKLTFPK